MHRTLLFALLCACAQPSPVQPAAAVVDPGSCGARGCSTSSECGDIHSSCNHCFGGGCSATLPADPKPDAGIDAAPGGTTP